MEPLFVESSCVDCHAAEDYIVGEVAGATSIGIPLEGLEHRLADNALTLAMLGAVSAAAAVGTIRWMTVRLGNRLHEANSTLERVAVTDELTGLLNRRGTLQRLEEELARVARTAEPLSLVMLDLDRFKVVNDTHGHLVGDAALRLVADALRSEVRTYDIVGRFGGEEFVVITPDTDIDAASALAERIRERVSSDAVAHNGLPVSITVSAGVGQARAAESADALIARADSALYRAKDGGRNRVEREG